MKDAKLIPLGVLLTLAAAGCGQEKITLPDGGAGGGGSFGGECGAWYPGGGDAGVGDAGAVEYAVEEGATFPCVVWEEARRNRADTYINVGELHLAAKLGGSGQKALVFVVSARNCSACEELIHAIVPLQAEFEAAGAEMVGISRIDLLDTDVRLTLEEAETVLLESDTWPEGWALTHDGPNYLPSEIDAWTPWVIIVRLSDMQVMEFTNETYTKDNPDDLVSAISSL